MVKEINQKGIYSGLTGRMLYNRTKYLKENTLIYSQLNEAIEYEFEKEQNGGIITFSIEVNAQQLSPNKLANWIKQKLSTLKNKIHLNKNIDNIASKNGAEAWTIGHYLDGRYKDNKGKSYNENSLSLEIIGISSEQLQKIAEEICIQFNQESVLVKDFAKNKMYLVNGE